MKTVPINIQKRGAKIPSTEFSVRLSLLDLKRCSKEEELTSLLTILWTFFLTSVSVFLSIKSLLIMLEISFTLEVRLLEAKQLDKPKN